METVIKDKKLEKIIERIVVRILQKTFKDSDLGLELQPAFAKKLKQSIISKKAGLLKDFKDIILHSK